MSFVINAFIAPPYSLKVFVGERFTVRQLIAKIEREFCRKYGFSHLKVYALQDPNHHDLPLDCKVNLLLKQNDRVFVIVHPDSFRRKPNLFHPLLAGGRKRPADTPVGAIHDQQRAVARFRTSPSALNLSRSQLALNGISRSGLVTANDFLQAYFRLRESLIQATSVAPPKSPPSPRSLSPHSFASSSDNDSPLSQFLSQPLLNEPASLVLSSSNVPLTSLASSSLTSSASSSAGSSSLSAPSSLSSPSSSSSVITSSLSSSSASSSLSSSSTSSTSDYPSQSTGSFLSQPPILSSSLSSAMFSSLSSVSSTSNDSGFDSDSEQSIRSQDSANSVDSLSRRTKESEVVLQRLRQVTRLLSELPEQSGSQSASSFVSTNSSLSNPTESSPQPPSSAKSMDLESLLEQIPENRKHLLVEIGRALVEDLQSIDTSVKSLAELSNLCSIQPQRPLSSSLSSSNLSLNKQESKTADASRPALVRSISSSSIGQRPPTPAEYRVPPSLPLQRAASAK